MRRLVSCFDGRPAEEKKAFLDEPNEHGNTGIHWAALGGHLEIVKFLVEQGATPAVANEANYVALDLAMQNDKTEVAQYFLSSIKDIEGENQESGLKEAAESISLKEGAEDETK